MQILLVRDIPAIRTKTHVLVLASPARRHSVPVGPAKLGWGPGLDPSHGLILSTHVRGAVVIQNVAYQSHPTTTSCVHSLSVGSARFAQVVLRPQALLLLIPWQVNRGMPTSMMKPLRRLSLRPPRPARGSLRPLARLSPKVQIWLHGHPGANRSLPR